MDLDALGGAVDAAREDASAVDAGVGAPWKEGGTDAALGGLLSQLTREGAATAEISSEEDSAVGAAPGAASPPTPRYSPLSVAAFVLYHLAQLCRQHPTTDRGAKLADSQLPFCVVEDGDLNEALVQISALLAEAHAELERSRAVAAAVSFDAPRAALATIVESCLCVLEANVRCRSRANVVAASAADGQGPGECVRQRVVKCVCTLASDASPAIRRGAVALFATCASANFWFPSAEAQATQLLALLPPSASDAVDAGVSADVAAGAPSALLAPFADALCHPSTHIVKLFASTVDVAERVLARLLDAAFAPSAETASLSARIGSHSKVALMRLLLVLQRRVSSKLAASLQSGDAVLPGLTALTARYGRDLLRRSAAWVAVSSGGHARRIIGGRFSPVALLLPPMLAALSSDWVFPSKPVEALGSSLSSGVGALIARETMVPLQELFSQLNAANLRASASTSRYATTPAPGPEITFGKAKLLKKGAESWCGVECSKGADALALRFTARCTSASASDTLTVRRGGKHTWARGEVVPAAAVIPRLSAIGGARNGSAREEGYGEAAAAASWRHSWPGMGETFIVSGDTIALNWTVEAGGRSGRPDRMPGRPDRMPPRPGAFGGGGRGARGGGSASAEARLAKRLPSEFILFTVTFRANPAHNLTRTPNIFDCASWTQTRASH